MTRVVIQFRAPPPPIDEPRPGVDMAWIAFWLVAISMWAMGLAWIFHSMGGWF